MKLSFKIKYIVAVSLFALIGAFFINRNMPAAEVSPLPDSFMANGFILVRVLPEGDEVARQIRAGTVVGPKVGYAVLDKLDSMVWPEEVDILGFMGPSKRLEYFLRSKNGSGWIYHPSFEPKAGMPYFLWTGKTPEQRPILPQPEPR